MKYKTTYDYESPGPAGPFKGWIETDVRHKRGERIRGIFGMAIVRSSRPMKARAS